LKVLTVCCIFLLIPEEFFDSFRKTHDKINQREPSMQIKKIRLISFSPTRTSKKVIDAIASGMGDIPCETNELTYPDAVSELHVGAEELAIIGVPVYAGRVAPLAVKRLAALQGNKSPAVIVVTYGNRDFEDALIELRDIAVKANFFPLAAGTFIGEHSYSGAEMPIAADRPDNADLAAAKAFGAQILEKLLAVEDPASADSLKVPGNIPYKEAAGKMPFTPLVLQSVCTECGACLPVCPTGAISLESGIQIDKNLCIFCCACLKSCPEDALKIAAEPIKQKVQWLHENCADRKEPGLYL
jgi:ferredoxin